MTQDTSPPLLESSEEHWDLVISPKAGWFDLHLADLWRYRDLVTLFVWRDFVAVYKQTILGPLWHIIQPIVTTITFTIFFGKIAQLPTDGLPPFLFYMSGTVLWGYFSCASPAHPTPLWEMPGFSARSISRVWPCPSPSWCRGSYPSGSSSVFFWPLWLISALSGADIHPNLWLLLTPVLLIIMAALGLGGGIVISSLTTRYRDLQQLVGFGVQLLMYATPVIYPLNAVPENYRWIILVNPMTPLIEAFRYASLGAGGFNPLHLLYSVAVTVVILFLGILLFNHVERTFMDTV